MEPLPSNAKYGCCSRAMRSEPLNVGRSSDPDEMCEKSGNIGVGSLTTLNADKGTVPGSNSSDVANHAMSFEVAVC